MDFNRTSYVNSDCYRILESCLRDVLCCVKPLEIDKQKRSEAIDDFTSIVASLESLKGAVARPFGSFVSNLYTKWGDLDLSIEFPNNLYFNPDKRSKQKILADIKRALWRNGFAESIEFVPHARVPLLIFKTVYTNISCDVSVNNKLGRLKSKILFWISEIDERFRDMVFLIKEWAKAHNVNDPKSGTLNSFSLTLLVIFHFQTCQPAILPPLKQIYEGNMAGDLGGTFTLETHVENVCRANIQRFITSASREKNKSRLSELLVSFFEKFAGISAMASRFIICTHTGEWRRCDYDRYFFSERQPLRIKDPFEQRENTARAVSASGLSLISSVMREAHEKLSSHGMLSDRNVLSYLVRPNVRSQVGASAAFVPPWRDYVLRN